MRAAYDVKEIVIISATLQGPYGLALELSIKPQSSFDLSKLRTWMSSSRKG